jgi:hypothetical protein
MAPCRPSQRRIPTRDCYIVLVRVERLELPRLAAPEPKSGVSTNFTIPAFRRPHRPIAFLTRSHQRNAADILGPCERFRAPERGVSITLVFIGSKGKCSRPLPARSHGFERAARLSKGCRQKRDAAFHRMTATGSSPSIGGTANGNPRCAIRISSMWTLHCTNRFKATIFQINEAPR